MRFVERGAEATSVGFDAPLTSADAAVGASIAVDGVCLTVKSAGPGWWAADVVAETLSRSTLGERRVGDLVNLERPVAAGGRLDGHLVQGHVDAVGYVAAPAPDLVVTFPPELAPYLVEKGSVTVDGCSLTVVSVEEERFRVAVIPHTAAVTTLGRKGLGAGVNLEVDVIAKYVQRLLVGGSPSPYVPDRASAPGPAPAPASGERSEP